MIAKFTALVLLIGLSILCGLGNFWFTYGVWPKSWFSFVAFGFASFVLAGLMQAVGSEK